jgi:hypothetical protein
MTPELLHSISSHNPCNLQGVVGSSENALICGSHKYRLSLGEVGRVARNGSADRNTKGATK